MAGRPRGRHPTALERASGYGRIGFCKLCSHPGAQFLAAAIVRAENDGKPMTSTQMQAYMKMLDPDFSADRHVYYTHKKDHLTSPLVTAVQNTRENSPRIVPQSNREAMEMIRDEGMKNVIDHPETIGIDHVLKAVDIMEKRSNGPENLWVLLAEVQSGKRPELLVGEYKEVPKLESEEAVTP